MSSPSQPQWPTDPPEGLGIHQLATRPVSRRKGSPVPPRKETHTQCSAKAAVDQAKAAWLLGLPLPHGTPVTASNTAQHGVQLQKHFLESSQCYLSQGVPPILSATLKTQLSTPKHGQQVAAMQCLSQTPPCQPRRALVLTEMHVSAV